MSEIRKQEVNETTKNLAGIALGLGTIVIALIVLAFTYLVLAGLWWLVCLGTGLEFSWLAPVAIIAAAFIVKWIVKFAGSTN